MDPPVPGSWLDSPEKQRATHNSSHDNPPKMRREVPEREVDTAVKSSDKKRSAFNAMLLDRPSSNDVRPSTSNSETCQFMRERLDAYEEEGEQKRQKRNLAKFEKEREALKASVPRVDGFSKVGAHDYSQYPARC